MTWVLITGATAGIGEAAALDLARNGMRVIATGRSDEKLRALDARAAQRGLSLLTVRLDVASAESVERAKREVLELTANHGVDVLVNNAGYGEMGPIELLDAGTVERMFETNVVGLARVTRAFVPAMRERGRGRVINLSSLLGRMTIPLHGIYSGTKYAVEALSDALRREMMPYGVQVVVIEPSSIATGFDEVAFGRLEGLSDDPDWEPTLAHVRRLAPRNKSLAAPVEVVVDAIRRACTAPDPAPRVAAPGYAAAGPTMARLAPRGALEAGMRATFGLRPRRRAVAAPTRVALVTGAAGGIGRATSVRLAKAGYRVIATDRDRPALTVMQRAADEQRLSIETRRMDVTDEPGILALAAELGRIDVLVNNAGYAEVGPIELVGDAAWRKQLSVNVYGALTVTRAFAPAMREARRGHIVNVSSVVGVLSFPFLGVYSASKHALEAITNATRLELGAFGVQVCAVQPAFIRSGFTGTAKATLERLDMEASPYAKIARRVDHVLGRLEALGGEPADVARAVHRAATTARPAPRYRTPMSAILAAHVVPWLPVRASDRAMTRFFT